MIDYEFFLTPATIHNYSPFALDARSRATHTPQPHVNDSLVKVIKLKQPSETLPPACKSVRAFSFIWLRVTKYLDCFFIQSKSIAASSRAAEDGAMGG